MDSISISYIEEYIRKLLPDENNEIKQFREECEKTNLPIIHKDTANIIDLIINLTSSKKILEIGTNVGFSAIYMSNVINDKNGKITTIERSEKFALQAENNFSVYRTPTEIQLLKGDALEMLSEINEKFDIIFFDAAKSRYRDFLDKSLHLLKPSGVIISDNVLYRGMIANDELVVKRQKTIVRKMRAYLEYISNDKKFVTSVIPIGDGLAISYYKGEPNE